MESNLAALPKGLEWERSEMRGRVQRDADGPPTDFRQRVDRDTLLRADVLSCSLAQACGVVE
jgi:hypothetical protein